MALSKWLVVGALLSGAMTVRGVAQSSSHDDCRELLLYNGRITTMDARNTIASSVTVRNDRIAAVGLGRGVPKHNACATVVNLGGRRVIPGLIENHDHLLSLGVRPGHDTRLETAFSLAAVAQAIRARTATVPAGEWITAIGGWDTAQLVENRLPTLAELDRAAPNHPLYLQQNFAGPSVTNTRGKAFFQGKGIAVDGDGGIAINAPSIAALNALRSIQTLDDQKRGTLDAMAYAASLGLTTHSDQSGQWPPISYALGPAFGGTPAWAGVVQITNGGTQSMDPFVGYDALLALHREGRLPVRLRLFLSTRDLQPELPFLKQRLNNVFPEFGDQWLKVSGVGEWIAGWDFGAPLPAYYETAARLVAERGWAYNQHAQARDDGRAITEVWERVNAVIPLAPLRWCLAHVPGIELPTLNRLKAMGVGVSAGGGAYLGGPLNPFTPPPGQGGSPFRLLVDSGIHVGYGGDGANIAPIDPWLHMYYMVTGKNGAGVLVAPGQTLTRMEALRLYTTGNAWFTKEEDVLGSIEVGKLGDLVVLSDDFLDPAVVSDESIKRLSSVLTVVGGTIVHNAGILKMR